MSGRLRSTSLRGLSVALLVNLLHLLQQLAHVEGVRRARRRLEELIHQLKEIHGDAVKRGTFTAENHREAERTDLFFCCNFYCGGRNLRSESRELNDASAVNSKSCRNRGHFEMEYLFTVGVERWRHAPPSLVMWLVNFMRGLAPPHSASTNSRIAMATQGRGNFRTDQSTWKLGGDTKE